MQALLEGVKVLDFTTNVAGPVATATLADYGAEVIKVERPGTGDDNRNFPPMMDGQGFIHFWCNRGKKSITLDLGDPDGKRIVERLVRDCDMVVESYRPGIMKKFGLDYEALSAIKPDLIYCSVSAYGLVGPYAKRPGYDLIAQGMSGHMDLNGEVDGPPMKSGMTLGDYWAGLNTYAALVTAWYHKLETGEGQMIDASLLQNLLFNYSPVLDYNIGQYRTRSGNHSPYHAPYGLFCAPEGKYVVICVEDDGTWARLAKLIGHAELAGMAEDERIAHREDLTTMLETWLAQQELPKSLELLAEAEIPSCKMSDMHDVSTDPHILGNEWLVRVALPEDITTSRSWLTRNVNAELSKTPGVSKPSPALGNYNKEILTGIGMTEEEIDTLQARWLEPKKK